MAGKKGRSGRKSFELTIRAKSLVERHELLDAAANIATAKNEKASDRLNAIRFLVEYAYGKPPQPVSAPPGTTFTLKFGDDSDD